ncbi:MAG: polysaccharide biosynthesis/export family protein [Prevotella sp.]|nr:polysaccharide biosynthesis/export family protein [Prevotella sp.]
MKQKINLLAALLILLAASSCRTRTQMIYLQDIEPNVEYSVQPTKDLVIQTDDKLTIKVTCKNPELAMAFNMPGSGGYSIGNDGTIHSTTTSGSDVSYSVTDDGTIDFPILGKIHARGLTCRQLSESIKKELISRNLIMDPFVTTQITNFTYSVLGEAKKVGTIEVKGKDRVTILDAVAQAGDLTQDAKLERIAVIREENGKRKIYHVDIRSKSIFDSPVYYLKQNDLIYIEPNDNKVREESRRNMQWVFTGASLITTIISLITLFKK